MYSYIWYFFIFAFLGWCTEVAFAAVSKGKFVNRGFLNGPICPIYGLGVVLVYAVLRPVRNHFILLFLGAVLLTSILEWVTGFVLEKIFHHQWWDYSDKKLNLNGYICLQFSLVWGIACVFILQFMIPLADILIGLLPEVAGVALLIFFGGLLLADLTVTVVAIIGLNRKLRHLSMIAQRLRRDSDGIGQRVSRESIELKEKYDEIMAKQSALRIRILKAFPNMRSVKYDTQLEEIKRFSVYLREKAGDWSQQRDARMDQAYCGKIVDPQDRPFAYGLCFSKLFWLFMIGNVLGFVIETLWCLVTGRGFQLRVGVVLGPFIPVYGFGAVVITLCLYRLYKARDLKLFLISAVIGGAFEYLCSLFQEVAFGTVSWEYSGTTLNIGGRTNLEFALCWGLLGLIWIKDLYPRISKWIEKIPKKTGGILTAVTCVFIVLDMAVSCAAVARQSERRQGIPADSHMDQLMDQIFTDERLKVIYPNMRQVEK